MTVKTRSMFSSDLKWNIKKKRRNGRARGGCSWKREKEKTRNRKRKRKREVVKSNFKRQLNCVVESIQDF